MGKCMKDQETLKNEIIELQNVIRKKHKALKMGKIHMEGVLQDTFRPITEPLKEISRNIEQKRDAGDMSLMTPEMKKSIKNEVETYTDPFSTPLTSKERRKLRRSQLFKSENLPTPIPTITENETIPLQLNRSLDAIIRHLGAAVSDKQIDSKYGIRLDDATNTLKMGNMELKFDDEDNLQIGEKVYGTTPGLYKLILLKNPGGYTQEDLNNYRDILFQTNAFRRNYNPHGQVKGAPSWKYRNIIKNLIEHQSGEGLSQLPKRAINYTEMMERFQQAGEICKNQNETIFESEDNDDCESFISKSNNNDKNGEGECKPVKGIDKSELTLGKRRRFQRSYNDTESDSDDFPPEQKTRVRSLTPTSERYQDFETSKSCEMEWSLDEKIENSDDISESTDPNILVDELRTLLNGRCGSIGQRILNITNKLKEWDIIE